MRLPKGILLNALHMKWMFTALCIVFGLGIQAQDASCPTNQMFKITAKNGMKMRGGPGTKNEVVGFVPSKAIVLVCPTPQKAQTIEGIEGNWKKVKYMNLEGYMFDGFMESYYPATDVELLNDIRAAEPDTGKSDLWFKIVIRRSHYEQPRPAEGLAKDTVKGTPVITGGIPEPKGTAPEPEGPADVLPMDIQFLTESYNYCGDISSLDPGKIWYGYYLDASGTFTRKIVDLQIIKSKYSLGTNMEFDIKTDSEDASYFLIGVDKKLPEGWTMTFPDAFFVDNSRQLFPGMQIELYGQQQGLSATNVQLYATGNVTEVTNCPVISKYRMIAQTEKSAGPVSQDLAQLVTELGECGIPDIYWFGDISGDGIPEVILVGTYPEKNVFTLLSSDTPKATSLYRVAGTWTVENCE
ncbi:MAG: hypothetical protein SchgKO_21860 [Schleiferiaceae bacterium]